MFSSLLDAKDSDFFVKQEDKAITKLQIGSI